MHKPSMHDRSARNTDASITDAQFSDTQNNHDGLSSTGFRNTGTVRRSVLAAAIAITLAQGVVHADLSVGSIFGHTQQGVVVTVVNVDTGLKRELTADANGRFNFSQLPTGRYKVTANGVTRDAVVALGTGTPVSFEDDAERLTVVGASINPIDTSSVESGMVITAAQLEKLPVGRDISDVALLAPGTVRGDSGFGKLASFGGASVAENGYYVNGFDVTNARTFLSYASIPFDAIGEQQTKTGGYGAEYGRALGGVINIVTKRGSNEWKFNASAVWTPSSLTEPGKDVVSRHPGAEPGSSNYYSAYRSDDESEERSLILSAGGPLIQDKLFFFAMVEGRDDSSDTFLKDMSQTSRNRSPNTLVKLDWYLTDDHIFEFTGIRNVEEVDYVLYHNAEDEYFTGRHGTRGLATTVRNGGDVLIGKYTGHFTDNFTFGILAGKLKSDAGYVTPDPLPGEDCPVVDIYDQSTDDITDVGCWALPDGFDVRTAGFGPDQDERDALRLDGEWVIGTHTLRFGYDDETFTSSRAGTTYSGGAFYRLYTPLDTPDRWNGVDVDPGAHVVRKRTRERPSGSYEVQNRAIYIEDSFYVTDSVLVYAGLRNESFDNKNADGISFVDAKDMIAPRIGFSWDVNGDASSKLFANAGRYFIPIAANTNIRASNWQYVTTEYYLYDGTVDPRTNAPRQLGTKLGDTLTSGRNSSPVPGTVASTDLEPMLQDELIIGYQRELMQGWTGGVRFIAREVKNGVDDYCGQQAFIDFAADQGYDDFDPETLATCIILNPGRDLSMDMDVANDGELKRVVVPNSYLQLEEYKRTYKALELFWERSRADGWYLQGSYVYAKSQGNSEGLVNSWLESESPGLTNDFDHKVFVDGTNGYLSNDRRHTLKLFGSYELNDEMEVSANLLVQSGRPVSCFGYAPFSEDETDYAVFERYAASTLYCRNESGEQVLTQRGQFGRTPWIYSLDVGFSYTPDWAEGLLFQVKVFNLFDTQRVTEYDEMGDVSLEDTDRNPDFRNDLNYQSPRSVRFTMRYSF